MKNYEVVLNIPSTVDDWCGEWGDRVIKKTIPTTTAIICAFSETRLKDKISRMYPNATVLKISEMK